MAAMSAAIRRRFMYAFLSLTRQPLPSAPRSRHVDLFESHPAELGRADSSNRERADQYRINDILISGQIISVRGKSDCFKCRPVYRFDDMYCGVLHDCTRELLAAQSHYFTLHRARVDAAWNVKGATARNRLENAANLFHLECSAGIPHRGLGFAD